MKKIILLLAILTLSGCATAKAPEPAVKTFQATTSPIINITNKIYMKLVSPDFKDGNPLASDFSCQGKGNAPLLNFSDVPAGTVSLALIFDDPDATIGVFTHWTVWNLSVASTTIDAKKLPREAVVGLNSAATNKYYPPCPAVGLHHYYFRLYALDKKLNLPAKTDKKALLKEMEGHILGIAVLMGTYEKK